MINFEIFKFEKGLFILRHGWIIMSLDCQGSGTTIAMTRSSMSLSTPSVHYQAIGPHSVDLVGCLYHLPDICGEVMDLALLYRRREKCHPF